MPTDIVTIREAGLGELNTVVRLIRMLYGQDHEFGAVKRAVFSLEPSFFRTWIAYAGREPIGITSLQVRTLQWGSDRIKAGYWGNLFVRPEYRKLLVYPQIVSTMLKGALSGGIDIVYTGTRRPFVAEAHRKLGFHQIGVLPVLIKPLRPLRLVVKYKEIGDWALRVTNPLDKIYALGSNIFRWRKLKDTKIRDMESSSHEVSRIVEMMNTVRQGLVSQVWSTDYFRRRFEGTIDGGRYSIISAKRRDTEVAAVISCSAMRGNNIRACVIMDVVYVAGEEERARGLVGEVEDRARRAGCDCVLYLDDFLNKGRKILGGLGYRNTNDTYHMLVWPKNKVPEGAPVADIKNWWFTFSEHDAF